MEAFITIKIIGIQNDGRAVFFISSKYRVTKVFKFHARPQTGAYSCFSGKQGFVNPDKLNSCNFEFQ